VEVSSCYKEQVKYQAVRGKSIVRSDFMRKFILPPTFVILGTWLSINKE